ncbi:MAG: A24 family peptidase [Phycisphaerales bacterium]|nr:A24 family peptidase [Phycisphaerales bacterium]
MTEPDPAFELLRWTVLIGCGLVASWTDLGSRRIPNWLTFPMVVTGLVCMLVHGGLGWIGGLGDSFLGILVVSMPLLLVYALGGGGAGDVKFMMGVGAWSGVDLGLYLLGGVMVLGFFYAIAAAAVRGELRQLWYGVFAECMHLVTKRRSGSATLPAIAGDPVGDLEKSHGTEGVGSSSEPESGSKSTAVWAFGPIMLVGIIIGGLVHSL